MARKKPGKKAVKKSADKPTAVSSGLPAAYGDLLEDIKTRVQTAQRQAARTVNRELLQLYWVIGLLLCKTRNRVIAEYALRDISKPIGVAECQTQLVDSLPDELKPSLPSIEEIEAEFGGDQ